MFEFWGCWAPAGKRRSSLLQAYGMLLGEGVAGAEPVGCWGGVLGAVVWEGFGGGGEAIAGGGDVEGAGGGEVDDIGGEGAAFGGGDSAAGIPGEAAVAGDGGGAGFAASDDGGAAGTNGVEIIRDGEGTAEGEGFDLVRGDRWGGKCAEQEGGEQVGGGGSHHLMLVRNYLGFIGFLLEFLF